MRTEHFLFHVIGITPKPRMKFVYQFRKPRPSDSLLLTFEGGDIDVIIT